MADEELSKKETEREQREESEFLSLDEGIMDLFRMELENQSHTLNQGLIAFEQLEGKVEGIEPLMRAAHSIKGAGRVVRLESVVALAHEMEDCFVALQKQKIAMTEEGVDLLLRGVDVFSKLAKLPQKVMLGWLKQEKETIEEVKKSIKQLWMESGVRQISSPPSPPSSDVVIEESPKESSLLATLAQQKSQNADRVLRITAQKLNRLMGLAGESMVESRWLQPFSNSLLKIKKEQIAIATELEFLSKYLEKQKIAERTKGYITQLHSKIDSCRQGLVDRVTELDSFIVLHSSLSDRLYREVIDSRMRPFSDDVEGFPRMVRDLARRLNKKVRLQIIGKDTPVDREILEKLEAPLGHILRNAVDHGIEPPEVREALGKPAEGVITLKAEHRSGMLAITISDDGQGIDIEVLRKKIVGMNLVVEEMAGSLTEAEILEFLFLPGFSTAKDVTDISGRGVGLDVVQNMVQEVAGTIRITQSLNVGTNFYLQLPLTLSVIHALIVEISHETFAFPLARIDRSLIISKTEIEAIEHREYFNFHGENIGLVVAAQVLEMKEVKRNTDFLPVIVISDRFHRYGLVVDKLIEERELVVQELDPRLGKVQDISAGALLEDGSPVLIFDVEDLARSIDMVLSKERLKEEPSDQKEQDRQHKKRILVVDDSITVREVECRLLREHGYEVETAINGVDGWNAVRIGRYDLVVSDVDMPRMNGIELVKAIRADPRLKTLPVMIVSYKEREEDRQKGLEAGANYYLTKSSFHDETLIQIVKELIG